MGEIMQQCLTVLAVEKGLDEEAFHVLVTKSKQTLLKFGDYIIASLFIEVGVTIFSLLNRQLFQLEEAKSRGIYIHLLRGGKRKGTYSMLVIVEVK